MIRSKDETDNRLLNMARVKQARHLGLKIGFNGLNQDDYGDQQAMAVSLGGKSNVEF